MSSELPRWTELGSDASPELRAAITALCEDDGDDIRLARLESKFSAVFGAAFDSTPPSALKPESASGGPSTGAAGTTTGTSVAAKLGVLFVLGGSALAVFATVDETPSAARNPPASAPLIPNEHPATIPPSAPSPPAPEASPRDPEPPQAERAAMARRIPARAAREEPPSPQPSVSEPVPSISEEARLLRSARTQSSASSSDALSLLAEHERRFPNGALRDERELFAIELLARSGARPQALERLERLKKTSPGSPYLGAAERIVASAK